jgi:hypothetical protein
MADTGDLKSPDGSAQDASGKKTSGKRSKRRARALSFSSAEPAPLDPDLARVMDAWPDLPAPLKAAVLALV